MAGAAGFAKRTFQYVEDVRDEVGKVTWSSLPDLRRMTIVIIIFVVILGILIGLIDRFASWVLIQGIGRVFS